MRGHPFVLLIALSLLFPLSAAGPHSVAPHGSIFHPQSSTARAFGWAVAGLGDINGDGFGDIAISDPLDGEGAVFVYHGSATGFSQDPVYTIRGEDAAGDPSQFGYALAAVGDVDGDGRGDFAVGSPLMDGAHSGKTRAGRVYLFTTAGLAPHTPASQAPLILFGSDQDDRLGMLLSGGGYDVTGDGVPDFLASAPLRSAARGAVYAISGALRGVGAVTALASGSVLGEQAADELGEHAITFIPDVTGDGRAEWVVGGPEHGASDAGRVYLLTTLPQAANVAAAAARIWEGESKEEGFGLALAPTRTASGEVLLAAASFRQEAEGPPLGRVALLPPLALSGPVSAMARTLLTGFDGGTFGARIVSGDFEGDGFIDLIVGAPVALGGTESPGQISYIPGPLPEGVTVAATDVSARIQADFNGGRFGYSLAIVTHPDAIHPAGILVGQPRGQTARTHLLVNQPPVADFAPIEVPCSGRLTDVVLDGSRSTDPDGPNDIYQLQWTRLLDETLEVDADVLGIGVNLKLSVPVGLQTIQLVAVDNFLAKSPATQRTVKVFDPDMPTVSIRRPVHGVLYVEDEPLVDLRSLTDGSNIPVPVLHVGKVRVQADASDRCSPIARVDFYLDDRLVATDTDAPYGFEYDPHAFWPAVKHVFALAYDTEGNGPAMDCFHDVNTGWASPHHVPVLGEGPPDDAAETLVPAPLTHVISGHPKCGADKVDLVITDILHPLALPGVPLP